MKFFSILITFLYLANCQKYCDICKNHIACENDGKFSQICENSTKLIDLEETDIKHHIVTEHNKFRNEIALGNLREFQPAVRMTTMEWDNELAKLAELNVKTCKFIRDECHDTALFYFSGQNMARWIGFPAIDPIQAVDKAINKWFDEYRNADMSIINQYRITASMVGHFTIMVSDKNTKLGCAMLKTVKGSYTTYGLTCNYATSNIVGKTIYKSGKTGSLCKTGKNSQYRGLCSPNEKIGPEL